MEDFGNIVRDIEDKIEVKFLDVSIIAYMCRINAKTGDNNWVRMCEHFEKNKISQKKILELGKSAVFVSDIKSLYYNQVAHEYTSLYTKKKIRHEKLSKIINGC